MRLGQWLISIEIIDHNEINSTFFIKLNITVHSISSDWKVEDYEHAEISCTIFVEREDQSKGA